MMKKTITIIALVGLPILAMASTEEPQTGTPVNLAVGIIDPQTPMDVKLPKAPVQPPYVTLDDHTLYIWSQHTGYTLTLLDDNGIVVYQTYVATGVQFADLPSTLSGSYTLQLSNDAYLFTGVIDLE